MATKTRPVDSKYKYLSLVTLVVQNSLLVLVMRYSKTLPGQYVSATCVLLAEILKLGVSLFIYIMQERQVHVVTAGKIWSDLFGPQSQWISMTVPAILYLIQNNLQYIAVGLLDAATFQVAYQLKILTTALFSVLLLSRSLSLQKWMALVMLTIGVAIVQTAGTKSAAAEHSSKLLGLAVVFCACCTSGLAGVWFERVLKGSTSSLYLRNVQMSLFSIIPGIFSVYVGNYTPIVTDGFFAGYSVSTVFAVLLQAFGGLVVASVVKYADNILKGFATSLSIILSSVASIYLFDFKATPGFILGCSIVLYSTHLYGKVEKNEVLPSYIPLTSLADQDEEK